MVYEKKVRSRVGRGDCVAKLNSLHVVHGLYFHKTSMQKGVLFFFGDVSPRTQSCVTVVALEPSFLNLFLFDRL